MKPERGSTSIIRNSAFERAQCRLLGLHRSNVYYDPVPESQENLRLMRMMDEEHLKRPHRGSRQMVDFFADQEILVNRKKIQRLMRKMGIEGMSPKRRTTLRMEGHQVYPYLYSDNYFSGLTTIRIPVCVAK